MLSNFELDLCMLVTINMYGQYKSGRGQMILGTYRKFHISCQLWLQESQQNEKKKNVKNAGDVKKISFLLIQEPLHLQKKNLTTWLYNF